MQLQTSRNCLSEQPIGFCTLELPFAFRTSAHAKWTIFCTQLDLYLITKAVGVICAEQGLLLKLTHPIEGILDHLAHKIAVKP